MIVRISEFAKCPSHPNQDLNNVCKTRDCPNRGLVCAFCMAEAHAKHSLDICHIQTFMREERDKATYERQQGTNALTEAQKSKLVTRLDQVSKSVKPLIKTIREEVNSALEGLEERIHAYYGEFHKKMIRLNNGSALDSQPVYSYNTLVPVQDLLKEWKLNLAGYYERTVRRQTIDSRVQQLLTMRKQFNLQAETEMKALRTDILSKVKNLKIYFTINESDFKIDLEPEQQLWKWSHYLKHEAINVGLNGRQQYTLNIVEVDSKERAPTKGVFPGILMEKEIWGYSKATYRWSFLIRQMTGFVEVGMCTVEAAQKTQFNLNTTKDSNHYLLNGENSLMVPLNDMKEGFTFKAGDTVTIEYNVQQAKLRWKKRSLCRTIQCEVSVQKGANYRPCVYMHKKGDQVEFVGFERLQET